MKVGDLIVIDPYWRSRDKGPWSLCSIFDPTYREGQRGVVLKFIVDSKGMNKIVVHLFDEHRRYFYYSPQHIRLLKEIPRYKKGETNDIPQWVKDESW